MKRRWISLLLVALLFALLAMTAALAETNDEIDLSIDIEESDFYSEPVDLDIPEEIDLLLGEPEIEEIEDILLDTSLDGIEPASVSASSVAANDGGSGDFEIFNGVLLKYNGPGGDVVIPDGVTKIEDSVFYDSNITSVVIPNSVTSIGSKAFARSAIKSITIPDSVTSIGSELFSQCRSLSSVSLGNGINTIPTSMFYYCSSLTCIEIPTSVKSIGVWAFEFCSNLESITILPNSVTSIGWLAFSGCTSITAINIPDGVMSIDSGAFSGCSKLSTVTISDSVNSIGSGAFADCSSLKSIIIPDSVIDFGKNQGGIVVGGVDGSVFCGCSNLTSVSLGRGLTNIGPGTFSNCWRLESITLPDGIMEIHKNGFAKCYSLADVTINNGEISIDNSAFEDCSTTIIFHTPCESKATKWAEAKGYEVIKSDHTPVTDPAVAPTVTESGLTEGSHCSACGAIFVPQEVIPRLVSLKECTISVKDAVYTGKALKPAPVVEYNGNRLVEGTDYTVTYKNNKAIGAATVTLTGMGNYAESVDVAFRINPKPVVLSKLTAGTKQLTVTWKKGKAITGYQVQYSLKKNFASARTVTIKKAATVSTVLKKLTSKKVYYVRVRTYKTVKGKKYYSAWSKAKAAKVK